MTTNEVSKGREERRRELTEMWKDRRGQHAVLSLFHRALPNGEIARAGMSVFDVIVQDEFGSEPTEHEAGEQAE